MGVLPVAVSDGSRGWRNQEPPSVVVSGVAGAAAALTESGARSDGLDGPLFGDWQAMSRQTQAGARYFILLFLSKTVPAYLGKNIPGTATMLNLGTC
jgi:hypothetical protein